MNLKQLKQRRLLPFIAVSALGAFSLALASCSMTDQSPSKSSQESIETLTNARGQSKQPLAAPQEILQDKPDIDTSTNARGQNKSTLPVENIPEDSANSSLNARGQSKQNIE